jgi:hypothetical protein
MTGNQPNPGMSAVTGKLLSPATRAGYAANWALFTDWCTATNRTPLPADWATITEFTAGCPGAPATLRRRLAAITHHHRTAGHPPPADPVVNEKSALPLRELIDPGQVEMLLRLLPSCGWTTGMFGRRDRALLTLAADTAIPYRQIAALTVGQLHIAGGQGGGARITDALGAEHVLVSNPDPVLCGPCTLVRWRRVLNTVVTRHATRALVDLLKDAEKVTASSHHPCQAPKLFDEKTLAVPLFPPINQWGHLPEPLRPLSPHAASHLARQADTGIAHHKTLDVAKSVTALTTGHSAPQPVPGTEPPMWDWAAANQKKKEAITAMVGLTETMDDIDARINALLARTRDLELG